MTFEEYRIALEETGYTWVRSDHHLTLTFVEGTYADVHLVEPPSYTVVVDGNVRRTNHHDTIEVCQLAAFEAIMEMLQANARTVESAILRGC